MAVNTTRPHRVHLIAAARPNFMKIAPLWHLLEESDDFAPVLIHTGQHYDANMSDDIFADLGLPAPDHYLGVGSGSHAEQTGGVMVAYEKIAIADRPDWLIVVGDVNSTAACALVGAKLSIRTIHLEAGLRSRDRAMPEEINRMVTDAIADVLWTPSPDADDNLLAEGVPADRVTRVGNIMLDSYEAIRARIAEEDVVGQFELAPSKYAIVTLHRPTNVDTRGQLSKLVAALIEVAGTMPIVFPVHPRTRERLVRFGLIAHLETADVRLLSPLSYVPFMGLVSFAALVITDSGGVQEETTYLGIPCLTLRDNTERPITIVEGTNRLVTAETLVEEVKRSLTLDASLVKRPEFWDGHTAQRCLDDLRRRSVPFV